MSSIDFVKKLNLVEGEQLTNCKKVIDYVTKVATDNAYKTFMQHVHPDEKVRNESKDLSETLEKEMNELSSSKAVFNMIEGLDFLTNDQSPNAQIYRNLVRDMRRSGCHLSDEDNKRCKDISDRMTKLGLDFNTNAAKTTPKIELDGDELLGLQDFITKYNVVLINDNTMELKGYGLYFKLLDYCDVESVRRKAYIAFNNVAKDNLNILEELQTLRQEYAILLGYKNHAEFKLAVNAIGTPTDAIDFLQSFKKILDTKISIDQKLVHDQTGVSVDDLMIAYNNSYYMEQYRVQKHNVDGSYYRNYFELTHTLETMLTIYEDFFEVKFVKKNPNDLAETDGFPVWDSDVQLYSVYAFSKGNVSEYLGKVYLDLHARDGKWSHPSHFGMILRHRYETIDEKPHDVTSTLVMSLSQETDNDGNKHTLLSHEEAATLFHEFGHAMHELLNAETNASIGGTRITHDLVEVPSMFLEYLCWDPVWLSQIAIHYKTGEPLTNDKLNALVATKHVCPSFGYLRQLGYGLFDLTFHTTDEQGNPLITVNNYNEFVTSVSHITRPENTIGIARFTHLVGYDAQYYTYMYSESYAAMIHQFIGDFHNFNHVNKKKYLEFLRHSTKETLVALIGKCNPKSLLNEIFT